MKEYSKCLIKERDDVRTKLSQVRADIKAKKAEIAHLKQQLLKKSLVKPNGVKVNGPIINSAFLLFISQYVDFNLPPQHSLAVNPLLIGGALVKWPKYFFLPIAMKLAGNREWPADYLTSRLKFFLAEGPCFSRNMLKKSILPVKWGVMLNDQDVKVHYLNYGHQDNYW